jgi:hypothetical protein
MGILEASLRHPGQRSDQIDHWPVGFFLLRVIEAQPWNPIGPDILSGTLLDFEKGMF